MRYVPERYKEGMCEIFAGAVQGKKVEVLPEPDKERKCVVLGDAVQGNKV